MLGIIRVAKAGACMPALKTGSAGQHAAAVMVPIDFFDRRASANVFVPLATKLYKGANESFRAYD
jgi:hypothetical protein